MTQQPSQSGLVKVTPDLGAIVSTTEAPELLSCQALLVGETRERALTLAKELLPKILDNPQILTTFGRDEIAGVNKLGEDLVRANRSVDLSDVSDALADFSRHMRNLGKKYDPSDPEILEKYKEVKGKLRRVLHFGKTFFDEFMEDLRDLPEKFDHTIEIGRKKQEPLNYNIGFYTSYYKLSRVEEDNLTFAIGVMEMIRDLAAEQASQIPVGNANLGDRGAEDQALILDLVQVLEDKITAYKVRLWSSWGMAPLIRNLRQISFQEFGRIDNAIDIELPTQRNWVAVWITMSQAQAAQEFISGVDAMLDNTVKQLAATTKVAIPAMAAALARPPLTPQAVLALSESVAAQADSLVQTIQVRAQAEAELEDAMLTSKQVFDESTMKVNRAMLDHLNEISARAKEIEVARSVPNQLPAGQPGQDPTATA